MLEQHDAMQIQVVRSRSPFESGKCRKFPWLVVFVGKLLDSDPKTLRHFRVAEFRLRYSLVHIVENAGERGGCDSLVVAGDLLSDLQFGERAVGVLHILEYAHVFCVLRHGVPVERLQDLQRRTVAAARNALALGPAIGVVGLRNRAVSEAVK